jgi:predicted permease
MKRTTAAAIVVVLALGTGGALGLFSLLDAIALRRLSLPRPDELVAAIPVDTTMEAMSLGYPPAAYEQLAGTPGVFKSVAGVGSGTYLGGAAGSDVRWWMSVGFVSGSYFDVLDIRPQAGRFLTAADVAASLPVAVASAQFASHRLGGSARAVGSTITLQGVTLTIVGVEPASFMGIEVGEPTDLTVAQGLFPALSHESRPGYPIFDWLIGRRAPGVTTPQVAAELQARWPGVVRPSIPSWLPADEAHAFSASRLEVVSAATGVSRGTRAEYERLLAGLFVAAILVVALACANVSTLLLAQSAARERELGIRAALGATRARLVRLVLAQALRLSVAGTLVGLVIAVWSARALTSMIWWFWDSAPFDFAPDRNVIVAVIGTAIASALAVVVLPAVRATRSDLIRGVRASAGASARTRKWGHRLLVAQVAVATVLLAAGWMVNAQVADLLAQPGVAVDGVTILTLDQRPGGYPDRFDIDAYDRRIAESAVAVPGIRAAGLLGTVPFAGFDRYSHVRVSSPGSASQREAADFPLSPGALGALELPVIEGRDFSWSDVRPHPRVAIVSALLAREMFGATSAVGQRLHVDDTGTGFDAEVVGVTADSRLADLHQERSPIVFSPLAQEGGHAGASPFVILRTPAPTAIWIGQLRARIQAMAQDDVANVTPMSTGMRVMLLRERIVAVGGAYFAALAGLLVAVGLSGVLAYSVSSRTREMGIRSAIGASSRSIRLLVIREAMTTVAIGVAIGLIAAAGLARLASLSPIPLGTFSTTALAGATTLMLFVGFAAAWFPARRATAIAPLDALRSE